MWQIENKTPFAAERGWTRDRDGAEVWLVAAKCTFDIHPDGTTWVSSEQPDVLRLPVHNGKAGASSVRYESDLILTKTTTDVILTGQAHAPAGRPVEEIIVEMRVGSLAKKLLVCGERRWISGGPSRPEPFLSMPIVYERAFGGVDPLSAKTSLDWDVRNPVGTGFATQSEHLEGRALPCAEYCDQRFESWNDRPAPAGLGPLCSHWEGRARFAGTYDDEWMHGRQPLLPSDFDERFFQCAPPDQQTGEFLCGGEPVVLINLSPVGPLRFYLPRIALQFDTFFTNGEHTRHDVQRLHTVVLEPDFPRVSVVWHTALPCHFKVQKLERTVVTCRPPA
jgi:hypothetical protein